MTAKEAIQTIEAAKAEVEWNYPLDYAAAFEVAIKALEKQMMINKTPAVDATKVVLCKNCRFYEISKEFNKPFCNEYGGFVFENDFCSRAEKKGEQK